MKRAITGLAHVKWFLAAPCLAIMLSGNAALAADCSSDAAAGTDWQGCKKSMVILEDSDLSGANLVEVDFTSTDLAGANLKAAKLEKATLVRASLAKAQAEGADFSYVQGYRTDFRGIEARGATFTYGELQRSDFTGANLEGADFEKAELGRAQFDDATITGSRFSLSNLARADLRKAKFTGPLDFSGAFFFQTRIGGVDLSATTGLQQWQIDMACGDDQTKLPAGLTKPAGWPCALEE